ncbi:unnamed protein product [Merluccius merluccius]
MTVMISYCAVCSGEKAPIVRRSDLRAISRDAARSRRKKEADVFTDLSLLLPLAPDLLAHLDKPSVLRLTISYMRTRGLLADYSGGRRTAARDPAGPRQRSVSVGEEEAKLRRWGLTQGEADLYLEVSEGFLLVVSTKGDMVFVSDNVSKYIGQTQVDLIGHSLYDFAHPCDHKEIENNLRISGDCCLRVERDFVMRMKSTLTHRGRTTNIKSATWKVLHCQGRMKARVSSSSFSSSSSSSYLLLSCKPLLLCHRLVITQTFTSQHCLDLRFTRCDHRQLLGCSLYQLCHSQDTSRLTRSHLNLLSMSQAVSGQYRMLVRGGGYVWVESHSSLLRAGCTSASSRAASPSNYIFSITYILR